MVPDDEADIREMIARWSKAVRDKDLAGIRADHDEHVLMFEVPPPFLSRGLDAYMVTWETFFTGTATPVVFDFDHVEITAGQDVAFATAIGSASTSSAIMRRTGTRVRRLRPRPFFPRAVPRDRLMALEML